MIAVIFLNLPQQENYTLPLLHQLYRESQIGMQHTCVYIFLVALQLICTCMYNYNYSDGSLTSKQIHECLKADEVETISILYMY